MKRIFLPLLLLYSLPAWPATVENTAVDNDNFGTSVTLTLGFTPSAGNALICATRSTQNVTAVDTGLGQGFTSDFTTKDVSGTDEVKFWSVLDVTSGSESEVDVTLGASATAEIFCAEVSGLATTSALDDTVAWAGTGEIFSTTHDFDYTTDTDGEFVVGVLSTGNTSYTGASGTTTAQDDASNTFAFGYKIAGSAGAGTLNWTLGAAATGSAALVTYRPTGGSSPVIPVLHHQLRNQ